MVRRPVPPLVNVSRAYFYTGAAQRFPFQVTSCGHFVVGEGFYTERDKREDYQLLHTLEGAGYLIVDGVRREIPAGSYVMIDCSRYHYYAVNGNHWVYDYVHLAGDGMKPFLDNAFTLPLLFFPSEDTMLNSYMSTILNTHIQDDIVGYSQACALGASILNEIVKECERSRQLSAKEIGEQGKRNIEGALLFMRCHYMETITLDDLVRETYMTKYHFCHPVQADHGHVALSVSGARANRERAKAADELRRHAVCDCRAVRVWGRGLVYPAFQADYRPDAGELRAQYRKRIGEE